LLEAAAAAHDRILEHSLIYALIEVADPKATFAGLQSRSPGAQRAALIALDQMDEGKLASATVLPLLNSSDSLLKQTATWIIGHRREWAGELASFFRRRLTEFASAPENSAELQSQIVQFAREKPIQQVITDELSNSSTDVRLLLLRVIAQASIKTVPSAWNGPIRAALQNENDKLVAAGLEAARAISAVASNSADFSESLLIVARNAHRPEDLRLQALAVVPAASSLDEPLFEFSRAHVAASYPPLQRINAANVLGRSTLSEEQLNTLASDLPRIGPLELTRLLPAFGAHPTEPIGLKLISNLKQSKGMNTLAADALRTRLNKYPESVQKEGDALLQSLVSGAPEKKRHLDEIQAALSSGDYRRGQTIFNGTKAACSTCHAVGYLGGQLGPDLTRIGGIRTERDLLEAVVYPSASFVRGFEPMIVTTKSGDEYSGLVRRETSDSLVVVSSPATEQRLARAEVSEMRPGAVSIMPEGLDQQLTRQELADLVAFLRALK
jgi:putative heme-binding domain-containing protein